MKIVASQLRRSSLIALSLCWWLTGSMDVAAKPQRGDPLLKKFESDPSLVWVKPHKMTYTVKPRHGEPAKKRIVAPLLSLRWMVEWQDKSGDWVSLNPVTALPLGTPVRLVIKANQSGYLYLIDAEGKMLFPDVRVNRGGNRVAAQGLLTIPSNCETPRSCYFEVNDKPDEIAAIFSRELISDLDELRAKSEQRATARQHAIRQVVSSLQQDPEQKLRDYEVSEKDKVSKKDNYWIQASNLNRVQNRELVTQMVIRHQDAKGVSND